MRIGGNDSLAIFILYIDSRHIKKHKNDVITMSNLLPAGPHIELPSVIRADFAEFIAANADSADRLRHIVDFYELFETPQVKSSLLSQFEEAKREAKELNSNLPPNGPSKD
jgi:hypothetical protein